jgi:hypothetical protein
MAATECKDCSKTNARPTILGVGWCANCKKAASGVVVNSKRQSTINPKYAQQVPSNVVTLFSKAVARAQKNACTVKTQSVASPSKLGAIHKVSARLPAESPSPEPPVTRVSKRAPDSGKRKLSDRVAHDDTVAQKMKRSAAISAAASANASDIFELEDLGDAQPFLSQMTLTASLAAALQVPATLSATPAILATSSTTTAVQSAPIVPPEQSAPIVPPAPQFAPPSAAQVAHLLAPSAAPKAKGSKKGTVPRQVSKSGKTHAQLSVDVRAVNKNLPAHLQLKNVKQATVLDIDNFLQRQNDIIAAASIHAQCDGAKSRLTQAIQVNVCLRMLTLLVKRPDLLALYQDSCAGSDRQQNDAGANPASNPGMGMGLNHAYFQAMETAFNDSTFVDEFPFEYWPPTEADLLPMDSSGINRVPVPPKIINGLFVGMGIKECLVPEGFPSSFFDVERLSTIFTAGLAEYHLALSKFSVSGQHGKPLWFFVAPRKTVIPEDQYLYLDLAAKRWDSLAFHLMFEQVQELSKIFTRVIPNGKGGADSAETRTPPPPVGSSVRVTASRDRENAEKRAGAADARSQQFLEMRQERHVQHMASKKATTNCPIETLTKLKALYELKTSFVGHPDQLDLVKYCEDKIAELKKSLTTSTSSTASTTTSSSMFNTPGPATPSGAFTPMSPIPNLSFSSHSSQK